MVKIKVTKKFLKDLKSIDRTQQLFLLKKIKVELNNINNPKTLGKPLKVSNESLREYQFGIYSLIATINKNELLILSVCNRQNTDNLLNLFN